MKKRARNNSWSVNSGREAEQVGGDTGEGEERGFITKAGEQQQQRQLGYWGVEREGLLKNKKKKKEESAQREEA